MSRHSQNVRHLHPEMLRTSLQRRAEAALGLLLALTIGAGLAAVLVAWWSS